MSTNDCQELRECPFCGGEARVFHYSSAIRDEVWRVVCSTPFCAQGPDGYTEAEAIAAWNTRTDYHGYEQTAIEAWENIKAWNTRAERTCRNTDTDDDTFFKCSACGAECSVEWCHSGWGVPSYCPNCGARVEQ